MNRIKAKESGQIIFSSTSGGTVAGLSLGILTLISQDFIPNPGLNFEQLTGIGGYLTTISHFVVAHALIGVLTGLFVLLLAIVLRRRVPLFVPASLSFSISVLLYAFIFVVAQKNLSLPANVTLSDPLRIRIIRSAVITGFILSAFAFFATAPLFMKLHSKSLRRLLASTLLFCAIISTVRIVQINSFDTKYEFIDSVSSPPLNSEGKVIVIGIDGASWQLLDAFATDGLLPNINRLRHSGVTTNLVTHGRRLSPAVWTGIITGWSHEKHQIVGWTLPEPSTGLTRPVRSTDRKKPALWQILSEYGKTAVVINWLASYPAEPINGVIISRIVDMDDLSVYPREILPEVRAIVDSSRSAVSRNGRYFDEVEALFNLAEHFLSRNGQPDLLMVYVNGTDKVQHKYWVSYEPEEFDSTWGISESYITEGRETLRELWGDVDRRIGELLSLAEKGTTTLIVSDHGFKPRSSAPALPQINRLLHAMGYVEWTDQENKEIDFSRTKVFAAGLDVYDPMVGFYVNVTGRQVQGIVSPDSISVLATKLIHELSELTVEETGEPLFLSVGAVSVKGSARLKKLGFDVFAEKGSPLRTSGKGRTITLKSGKFELDDFMRIIATNTGNHAPRGVFLGEGPSFRPGTILPLVADSPYSTILTYVTGYNNRLEGLYSLLRGLGGLDSYTTIDVAPTVLYLLGLPISSKMEGRLMERVLAPDLLRQRTVTVIPSFDHLRPSLEEVEGTISEETLKQLRAIGYIQ